MTQDPLARATALLSPSGRELLDELGPHALDPLRVGTRLRERFPADLVAGALALHELRLAARTKFTRAERMFLTRPGLEQASSEVVARHRAGRYTGTAAVADLCCGIGGDLVALAGTGARVVGVDLDPVHLLMAAANAEAYGVGERVSTVAADVRDADLAGVSAVFVDPARRDAGGRRAVDGEPPLGWCVGLAERVAAVGVKAAPALPHDRVPADWELEFVALGRDLKEAMLWSPALATARRRATILPEAWTLLPEPGPPVDVAEPGLYLLDPNPAVTRAGLVQDLARRVGAWRIDERIAFLATGADVRTPFARTLRVLDSSPWHEKALRSRLRDLDVGAVDVRRRGLAGDVDRIQRRLKLTGTRKATLVMTRVRDRPWALVCVDP